MLYIGNRYKNGLHLLEKIPGGPGGPGMDLVSSKVWILNVHCTVSIGKKKLVKCTKHVAKANNMHSTALTSKHFRGNEKRCLKVHKHEII